jgi:hypothetical protein
MTSLPAEIVNRAFDQIARTDLILGDLEEGTKGAEPALRAYGPALRQLLRTAPWGFARKHAPLNLLADVTGQTKNVGTLVPVPWAYSYELPVDCMKARFVPWNSVPVPTTPPTMTGLGAPNLNAIRLLPAPFLISLDFNYPVMTGAAPPWGQSPQWWETAGEGPTQRTVILTNVQNAWLVYTALVLYPSQWNSLFEEAFVAMLTAKLAMPLAKDPKLGMAIQARAIAAAKSMIAEARATDASEGSFPQTIEHVPDFIRIRGAGGTRWFGGPWGAGGFSGPGMLYGGWDSVSFGDGSVF